MLDFSIYEVGPRDGLQSADTITPSLKKVELIERIAEVGIKNIEVGALVNQDKVPNMADSDLVFERVSYLMDKGYNLGVLVPNRSGVERGMKVGVENFNIFFSPSEYFNMSNLGRSTNSVFTNYCNALEGVKKEQVRVYLSTAFGCPYSGEISESAMSKAVEWANALGSTIVLCDTVGNANPTLIHNTMNIIESVGIEADLALHLHHGTRRGKMFDNLSAGFDCGVTQFDSSIGGMGGCPFIPGSGGNLATEQLVMWAEKEGLTCEVTLEDLLPLSKYVDKSIKV